MLYVLGLSPALVLTEGVGFFWLVLSRGLRTLVHNNSSVFPLAGLFSSFAVARQAEISKAHKCTGRKIIWSSWFYVGAARGYTYDVGLKAKAREHSSNRLPATANGI